MELARGNQAVITLHAACVRSAASTFPQPHPFFGSHTEKLCANFFSGFRRLCCLGRHHSAARQNSERAILSGSIYRSLDVATKHVI